MKTFKKAFIVNTSAITNSLSPHYYHKERQRYIDIFLDDKYKFEIDKLKRLFYISSSKTSASNVNKYIGMANIQSNTGIYIESDDDKGSGNCCIFSKGDILFGKLRPYLNKVYLAEFDGGCTTEFIVLTSKDNSKVSNKFLSIFLLLDCVVNQTKHIMTGNTLPRIQTYDIENLLIPLPPLETQNKIISIMDNAYKIKKANDQKAKELLDSIDEYLLNELGIILTEEEKKVSFQVDVSDIEGRLDPFYYKKEFLELDKKIQMNSYLILNKLALVKGGKRIPKGESYSEINTNYKYLRVQDIYESIKIDDLNSISLETYNQIENYELKNNDIILSNAGTIGRVAIFTNSSSNKVIFTENAVKITLNTALIKREFLLIIIESKYVQKQLEREFIQTTIPKLSIDRIKKIKIPLPALETQTKIANHIQGLREEAKQLQQEAKEVLASAKDEVEAIILK